MSRRAVSLLSCIENGKIRDGAVDINTVSGILLPVSAQKIYVNYPVPKAVNFMQEAILKILRCQQYDAAELSERLCLHVKLVEKLLQELKADGYLETPPPFGELMLTEKAEEMLREENVNFEMKAGYVFYDELNGVYLDNVFALDDELENLVYKKGEDDIVTVTIGSDGAPLKLDALCIEPSQKTSKKSMAVVESKELVKICHQYLSVRRAQATSIISETKVEIGLPRDLSKIFPANERPIPMYLLSFLYMSTNLDRQSEWLVYHPQHLFDSLSLKTALDNLKEDKKQEPLKNTIVQTVNRAARGINRELEMEDAMEDGACKTSICTILSTRVQDIPEVFEALIAAHKANYALAKTLNSKAKLLSAFSHFVNLYYKAYETALYFLYKKYESALPMRLEDCISGNELSNKAMFTDICVRMGFCSASNTIINLLFSRIRKGTFKFMGNDSDLYCFFAANLLVADYAPQHPFHTMRKKENYLEFLVELKRSRNPTQHDGLDDSDVDEEEITVHKLRYVRVMRSIAMLYDLEFNPDTTKKTVEGKIDYAARAAAKMNVEATFGNRVFDDETLSQYLIQMVQSEERREKKLIKSCAKAAERLFQLILDADFNPMAVTLLSGNTIDHGLLRNEMEQLGFEFSPERLGKEFLGFDIRKLKVSFDLAANSVLNAKLYMVVYQYLYRCKRGEREASILWKISRASKDVKNLFVCGAEISRLRGHSGESKGSVDEMIACKNNLFALVKATWMLLHERR